MKMNGLHESNSKLNIRSFPEAKKTDSDLLLLCPPALYSGLSTSVTLWCINHLRFITLSRSQVHMDVLHIPVYTLVGVCIFFSHSWYNFCIYLHIKNHTCKTMCIKKRHTHKKTQLVILKKVPLRNVLEEEIPPSVLSCSNNMGPHLSLSARGKTPSPGREGNRRLISSI